MSTDAEWEKWGKQDPYFGVITVEKYRKRNLTEEAMAEFFESGQKHIAGVLDMARSRLDQDFSPRTALDFGCGTGRLLIPLAGLVEAVTGLDVSDSMLREARANCERYGVGNVSLVKSDDDLSNLNGAFDLIHSFIVFQHIPVDRGRKLFAGLLEHLSDGGICAVQLTYAKAVLAESFGYPPPDRRHPVRRFASRIKRELRHLLRAGKATMVVPPVTGAAADPEMQMNPYLLNELFFLIQSLGVRNMHIEFTDHTGDLGVYLYFQKPGQPR